MFEFKATLSFRTRRRKKKRNEPGAYFYLDPEINHFELVSGTGEILKWLHENLGRYV